MRIAVLANVTSELLAERLGRLSHEIFVPAGFSVWAQEALEPSADFVAFAPEAVVLLLDPQGAPFEAEAVAAAEAALSRRFPSAKIIRPDVAALAADEGEGFRDERMRTLAASPYSLDGLDALAAEIDFLVRARSGGRKVLALDLDGTLWAGIVGEDGADGIVPRTDFQREILKLRDEGVVLVALSKNNAADVEPAWANPGMALRRGDFAAVRIDWNPKAENLKSVAQELNLGADAFVFLDDRGVERERMRSACPEVAVPEWPADAAELPRFLRRVARTYFAKGVTDEDRRRSELYAAASQRRDFAAGLTKDAYLKGLGMELEIHPVRPDECARIAQLSERTHQFNVSGIRYSADEVRRLAADPSRVFLAVRAKDRFGDEGLVAYAHFDGAMIVDFTMSCRVMDRTIEFALESALEGEIAKRGVREIRAVCRHTAKNAPVRDLFATFGFATESESTDATSYRLALSDRPVLHFIPAVKMI